MNHINAMIFKIQARHVRSMDVAWNKSRLVSEWIGHTHTCMEFGDPKKIWSTFNQELQPNWFFFLLLGKESPTSLLSSSHHHLNSRQGRHKRDLPVIGSHLARTTSTCGTQHNDCELLQKSYINYQVPIWLYRKILVNTVPQLFVTVAYK